MLWDRSDSLDLRVTKVCLGIAGNARPDQAEKGMAECRLKAKDAMIGSIDTYLRVDKFSGL